MPEMVIEGAATWSGATECKLAIRDKTIATVSPPPEFGGKAGYCVSEEVFAASLASCMNNFSVGCWQFEVGARKSSNKS